MYFYFQPLLYRSCLSLALQGHVLNSDSFIFLKREPLVRIELTTSSLPRKCSTTELQRLFHCRRRQFNEMSGRPGSNRPPEAWKATALPNELLPLVKISKYKELPPSLKLRWILWAELDSNQRTRERTDLQSVAFSHSAICPCCKNSIPTTYFFSK